MGAPENFSTNSYVASTSTYLSPPFLSYLAHRPWCPSPLVAPTMHLVFKPCPETLHTYFNYVLKHFYILEIPHMYVLWRLQKWLKLHVKQGILLARSNSMFTHPTGRFCSIFFHETFRMTYWDLLE